MNPIRVFRRLALPMLLSTCFLAAPAAKPKSVRTPAVAVGIKTPGIQIPFANLKPEARIPAPTDPDWVFFSKSAIVTGAKELLPFDPKTNKPAKPVTGLDKACGGMAAGFGSLWVPLCSEGALARVDEKDYAIKAKLSTGASSTLRGTIAATADSIWALVDDKVTLVRIDPDTNEVVAEVRLPAGCQGLTFGESALWVACGAEGKVLRINATTNLVEKRIDVAAQPIAVAVGQGSVWALCSKDGKVDRIDPKTNKVTKSIDLAVPQAKGRLAVGDGNVWVSLVGFPLTRIDPQTETVAQQFHGAGGGLIDVSPGAIWLLQVDEGSLLKIDPKLVLATLPE